MDLNRLQQFRILEDEICLALAGEIRGDMAMGNAVFDILENNDIELTNNLLPELLLSVFKAGKKAGKLELKNRIANL